MAWSVFPQEKRDDVLQSHARDSSRPFRNWIFVSDSKTDPKRDLSNLEFRQNDARRVALCSFASSCLLRGIMMYQPLVGMCTKVPKCYLYSIENSDVIPRKLMSFVHFLHIDGFFVHDTACCTRKLNIQTRNVCKKRALRKWSEQVSHNKGRRRTRQSDS